MKIITIYALVLLGVSLFAQDKKEDTNQNISEIVEMVVFPGCEEHIGNNKELTRCFATKT